MFELVESTLDLFVLIFLLFVVLCTSKLVLCTSKLFYRSIKLTLRIPFILKKNSKICYNVLRKLFSYAKDLVIQTIGFFESLITSMLKFFMFFIVVIGLCYITIALCATIQILRSLKEEEEESDLLIAQSENFSSIMFPQQQKDVLQVKQSELLEESAACDEKLEALNGTVKDLDKVTTIYKEFVRDLKKFYRGNSRINAWSKGQISSFSIEDKTSTMAALRRCSEDNIYNEMGKISTLKNISGANNYQAFYDFIKKKQDDFFKPQSSLSIKRYNDNVENFFGNDSADLYTNYTFKDIQNLIQKACDSSSFDSSLETNYIPREGPLYSLEDMDNITDFIGNVYNKTNLEVLETSSKNWLLKAAIDNMPEIQNVTTLTSAWALFKEDLSTNIIKRDLGLPCIEDSALWKQDQIMKLIYKFVQTHLEGLTNVPGLQKVLVRYKRLCYLIIGLLESLFPITYPKRLENSVTYRFYSDHAIKLMRKRELGLCAKESSENYIDYILHNMVLREFIEQPGGFL